MTKRNKETEAKTGLHRRGWALCRMRADIDKPRGSKQQVTRRPLRPQHLSEL